MNQYFVIKRNDTGRFNLVPGFGREQGDSHGHETFESARREASNIGGYVGKHYSRDDFNRDYEGGK